MGKDSQWCEKRPTTATPTTQQQAATATVFPMPAAAATTTKPSPSNASAKSSIKHAPESMKSMFTAKGVGNGSDSSDYSKSSDPAWTEPGSKKGEVSVRPIFGFDYQAYQLELLTDFFKDSQRQLDLVAFIRAHLARGKKSFKYQVWQLKQLTALAKASLQKQGTLVETWAPIVLCGDIHGHYSDLLRIFHACGPPHKERYLFLGDYVDRGRHSLEVISLLLACKVQFPDHIFLLRGNHELNHINKMYGFHDEMLVRFGVEIGDDLWARFNDVFSYLPLAATVGGRILCMHGGISPHLKSLDSIRNIKRPIPQVNTPGLVQDLLWSDPKPGIKGYAPNGFRNCSVIFGEEALIETLNRINIDVVYRAHQCCQYGYTSFAGGRLYTIFSTVRYHPDLCNWGAVVKVGADASLTRTLLRPKEFEEFMARAAAEDDQQQQQEEGQTVPDQKRRRSC